MRKRVTYKSFAVRYMITHIIVYLLFYFFFLYSTDYSQQVQPGGEWSEIFRQPELSNLFLLFGVQIVRSFLISAALYPFHSIICFEDYSWISLAFLFLILYLPGSPVIGYGTLEGFFYTKLGFIPPIMGPAQIAVREIVIAFIFTRWMKSSIQKSKFYIR